MKYAFKHTNFGDEALALVEKCNEIIEAYQAMGLRLTLRQLYYQLVSRNVVPNTERSYKNVGNLISKARLAGLVDWDAIEDRGRQPDVPSEWDSPQSIVESALRAYRLPRWEGQENYVELWVEKDALSGVLSPIARQYHVTLGVNKGYSSQSAMYGAAERFKEQAEKQCVLLYLGDHDPSGEDMVRDVGDRLEMMEVEGLEVVKVALTTPQVRQYNPPPNPAKVTDSRAAAYIAKHGPHSWEVDALPPDVLSKLVRAALDALVDRETMDAVIAREEVHKTKLRAAAARIKD